MATEFANDYTNKYMHKQRKKEKATLNLNIAADADNMNNPLLTSNKRSRHDNKIHNSHNNKFKKA